MIVNTCFIIHAQQITFYVMFKVIFCFVCNYFKINLPHNQPLTIYFYKRFANVV